MAPQLANPLKTQGSVKRKLCDCWPLCAEQNGADWQILDWDGSNGFYSHFCFFSNEIEPRTAATANCEAIREETPMVSMPTDPTSIQRLQCSAVTSSWMIQFVTFNSVGHMIETTGKGQRDICHKTRRKFLLTLPEKKIYSWEI